MNKAAPLRHLFWDFDGTLMDTYPGMVACFVRAAERVGIAAEPERVLLLLSRKLPKTWEYLQLV